MADRAINMPLRVTGIGEVERDFRRVGDAGTKNFAAIEKSANGAAREVSEYTARLKRAAAEANRRMAATPELFKGSATEQRTNQRDFRLGFINAEKDRIRAGLTDLTHGYGQAAVAADGMGMSLTRMTAIAAGAGTAIYALGNFLLDSVGAFAEHERALVSFNARLLMAGNQSNATADDIEAMAKKVVESTGQTEKAALTAAAKLATVPGITREGLEAALQASAKFADSMEQDVNQVVDRTAEVFTALAEKDMQALIKALEGVDPKLKAMIYRLAEAGKAAEAQQVYVDHLNKSLGLQGLSKSIDQAGDSWNRFKTWLGEKIEPTAVAGLNAISAALDGLMGKTDQAKANWTGYASLLSHPLSAPLAIVPAIRSLLPGGAKPAGGPVRLDLDDARKQTAARDATVASNASARAQVKAFEAKFGKDAKPPKATPAPTSKAALGDFIALLKEEFPTAMITSTTGGKHTKGSDHYTGRAVDFVVPGMMTPEGTAQVEARLKAKGVDIRRNANGTQQFFGPGRSASKPGDHNDHFHVAFDGNPSPERAAAAAERQREEAVRRQRAFEQETAGLDAEILRSRMAQVGDGAELAQLMQQQLKVEAEKYATAQDALVELDEQTQAQANQHKFQKAIALAYQSQAITAQEQTRQIQEAFADQVAANDNQRDLLTAQASIADTVGERRDLALALLELEQQEERDAQRRIIATGKLANATEDQVKAAEQAQRRLDVLPAIQGAERKGVERQNRTSLGKFIDDTDPGLLEDKANELVYDEMMSVRRGALSAMQSALGTDDPLITGLFELLLDQVVFRPLAQALQGAMGGGGGGIGGLFSGLLGALGGGGGFSGLGGAASIGSSLASGGDWFGALPNFASGTSAMPTGRDVWVGENGRERLRNHGNGRVEVISGPASHRESARGGGSITVVNNVTIPRGHNPRVPLSNVNRETQRGLARAARKGLA